MSLFGGGGIFGGGRGSGGGGFMPKPIEIPKEIRREATRKLEQVVERVSPTAAKGLRKVNETMENLEDTLDNARDASDPTEVVVRLALKADQLHRADHLVVQRPGYTHHGLYIGENRVIHYLAEEGVVIGSLEDFAQGVNVHVKDTPKTYSTDEVIRRGTSRLGESSYNLVFNNCEHFVVWCRSGRETPPAR